jgi:hypothetical protein
MFNLNLLDAMDRVAAQRSVEAWRWVAAALPQAPQGRRRRSRTTRGRSAEPSSSDGPRCRPLRRAAA